MAPAGAEWLASRMWLGAGARGGRAVATRLSNTLDVSGLSDAGAVMGITHGGVLDGLYQPHWKAYVAGCARYLPHTSIRPEMFMPRAARAFTLIVSIALTGCSPDGAPRPDAPVGEAAARNRAGELVYVTNEGSGELTVLDPSSDSIVATIPVGTRPRGVRVSADGRRVYVALSGSPRCPPPMSDEECARLGADKSKDGIGEVDAASHRLLRVLPGGSDPETFDLSRDGARIFVSNEDVDSASFVDVASGTILRTVPVGREPEGVRLHPDGRTVWVTGETDHDVTVLDTETGAQRARVPVGRRPRDLVFSSDGSLAYVSAEVGGTVSVVDARSYAPLRTIQLPEGARPMGLALTRDDTRLWVANGRGGTVSLVDLASDSVVADIEAGVRPWGIALTADGRKLYTANGPSGDVSVIDTETHTVLRRIPTGELPWGVAIAPAP